MALLLFNLQIRNLNSRRMISSSVSRERVSEIMKIAVVGSGIMGAGIAQILALSSYKVVVYDIDAMNLEKGKARIFSGLKRMLDKQLIAADEMSTIVRSIDFTTELIKLSEMDIVIEAASENMSVKKRIFKDLEKVCKADTILATNTSSLSVSEIASVTEKPNRVIGMHFFNPVPVMKAVEIIKGYNTDCETEKQIIQVCKQINKIPISVIENPGFVVNRLLIPMINEAIGILAEAGASMEDIDNAMKYGANHPIGPLALADLIGNDTVLSIMETLYAEFGDSKYRPHPLLKKMVRSGLLGKKSGRGFYDYKEE